jgi:molecular chaperone HscB
VNDVFEILGLKRAFTVDAKALQERFIALSAANHPDRYTDPLDQADAAERASVINDAQRVIADPMLRAQALLELLAPGASKADASALPPGFLMEVMEIREGIEEAKDAGDKAKLQEVKRQAEGEFQARLGVLGTLLDKACAAPDAQAVAGARLELNALRYVKRMIEGI